MTELRVSRRARTGDTVDVLHGETIPDPYRWLENGDDPETRGWTERQNALTERYLAARARAGGRSAAGWTSCSPSARSALPSRRAAGTSTSGGTAGRTSRCSTCATACTGADRVARRPQRARCRRARPRSTGTIPSEDGRLLAYGLSRERQRAERAPRARRGHGAPTRRPHPPHPRRRPRVAPRRHSGFYYTRYPASGRGSRGRGALPSLRSTSIALGADPAADPLVFRPAQKEYWPGVSLSPDGRWLLIGVARTFDQTDLYLGDRRRGDAAGAGGGEPAGVVRGRGRPRAPVPPHQSRRADLPAVSPWTRNGPRARRWRELIVPTRTDGGARGRARHRTVDLAAELSRAGLLPSSPCRSRGALRQGRSAARARQPVRTRRRSGTGKSSSTDSPSYTVPPSVYRIDLVSGEQSLWRRVEADIDPERFEVRQVSVTSPRRHRGVDVPRPPAGAGAHRGQPGLSHRLWRLQHQHDPGVLPLAPPLARAGRRRRDAQHPRRWGVRRGVAPGRDAGAKAEQLRRLHRRGGMADRRRLYPAGAAGRGRRVERRASHGGGAHPAAGPVPGGASSRYRCSTCCGTTAF